MNPFDVQRVMGHQNISTTMLYVNLAQERAPDMGVL
jgi:site-specific recombinase XerD